MSNIFSRAIDRAAENWTARKSAQYMGTAIAGTQAPSDIPAVDRAQMPDTPPPNNASQNVMSLGRMGWDVYQNYWSNAPSDIRAFLNLLYGWTNVAITQISNDYAQLKRSAYITNTTDGQQEEEEASYDFFASRLLRNPWPGVMGPVAHSRLKMRWLLAQPGGVFQFTPEWGTMDKEKQQRKIALMQHRRAMGEMRWISDAEFSRRVRAMEEPNYATLNESLDGMPSAFHILESSRVWIVADDEQLVRYYVYFSNSGPRYFAPWELCHIRDPYPSDSPINHLLWGSCPVERAWRAVGAANNIQTYISNFFNRFAMPAVMATKTRGFWTQEEKEEFESWWMKRQRLGAGGIGFAEEQGTRVDVVDTTKNQMKLYDVNRAAAEEIMAHFGLTLKHMLGDDQNRAQTHGHQQQYVTGPLRGWASLIDEAESMHLSRWYEGVRVGIIEPPSDERNAERDEDAWLIANAIATPNMIAAKRGIEEENPDGDAYFINQNLKPLSLVLNPPAPGSPVAAQPTKAYRGKLKKSAMEDDGNGYNKADELYGYWKAQTDKAAPHKRAIAKGVAKCYAELRKEILVNVGKSVKELDVNAPFDVDKFKHKLEEALGNDVADLISQTIESAIVDGISVGGDAEFDAQAVIDRAVDKSIDKITTSADTVKEELRALLQEMKDETAADVREAIKAKFDQYEDSGAARIAQTTTTYAQGTATKSVHKEMGVKSMWLELRIAKDPRNTHLALHKQIADEYGQWHTPNGALSHPGEGPAEEAINCHCILKASK